MILTILKETILTMTNNLIVLLGPTGVGKTDLSIAMSKEFDAPIVSSDSRQIYSEMTVGTAVPSKEQLDAVKHYFIQCKSIKENYTCGKFEIEALELLKELFRTHAYVLLTGGSGLYIDALCNGMDDLPDTDWELRKQLNEEYAIAGLSTLLERLRKLDPVYYEQVDKNNPQRIIRALEVCIGTGKPYSLLRTHKGKSRDFNIIKIGLTRPREELYERINRRVEMMLEEGLEEEARTLYPLRSLNALQTVGYKEFFDYFDGNCSKEEAILAIQQNSRRYAKRQMTWFNKDKTITWFHPSRQEDIIQYIKETSLLLDK